MSEVRQVVYPIAANERIHHLDVIRGVALLGILLANMVAFSLPIMYVDTAGISPWNNALDSWANTLVDWFVQGKFYTMFSFLFGVGFMIFLTKAEAKGYPARWLFTRRLFVLLAIGLVHALFIWWGDILVIYACCGFLLLLFYRMEARSVLIWSGVLFSISFVLMAFFALVEWALTVSDPTFAEEYVTYSLGLYDTAYVTYLNGTWSEIIGQNIGDWLYGASNFFFYPFVILPMFLLGAYAYKRGVIQSPAAHLPWIRHVWAVSLGVGIVASIVKYVYADLDVPLAILWEHIGATVGDASLSIFYMCTIVILYTQGIGKAIFRSIGLAGRMALTNYLMQSIICTSLFYGYGLGLYGLGASWTIVIALLLYTAQVLASELWLSRFQWGPAEYVWRKLTYGRLQAKD